MYFDTNINFQFLIFHCWYIKLQLILCILVIPGSSAGKETFCNAGDPGSISRLGRSTAEEDKLPTPVFLRFPGGSAGKESAHNVQELGSIPGLGRSPGEEGKGYPLQYSGLKNSMDCTVPMDYIYPCIVFSLYVIILSTNKDLLFLCCQYVCHLLLCIACYIQYRQ